MSSHQCPRCDLRFSWHTELDYHCREEHPDFRHEYLNHPAGAEQTGAASVPAPTADHGGTGRSRA